MKLFNDPPITGRTCGTCNVCCSVMGIKEELNKPNYTDCVHLVENECGSCGIYEIRPKPCKTFTCLWLSGHFGDEMSRPDNLGIMGVAFEAKMGRYEYAITLWATTDEVLKRENVKYMLKKVAEIRPIIIRSPSTFQIFGKRSEVEEIEKAMQAVNDDRLDIKETGL